MPTFSESEITLTFPDENYFRWEKCAGYKDLTPDSGFKEMDVCWYEKSANKYWLIELRDYVPKHEGVTRTIEVRAQELVKKAIDSLVMFLSVRHGYETPAAEALTGCVTKVQLPDEQTTYRFVVILHCEPSQKADIQFTSNYFKSKFKPYASLFGIEHYAVLEHGQAARLLPDLVLPPA